MGEARWGRYVTACRRSISAPWKVALSLEGQAIMSEENQKNGYTGAGRDFLRGQSGTEKGGWRKELQRLIDKHAGERLNGKVASSRTREATATELFAAFNTLHDDLGFKLQNPKNLGEKHIQALVNHWYRRGLVLIFMQN